MARSPDQERIVNARRARLREWLNDKHGGSQESYLASLREPYNQGQLSDMAQGTKSFGEVAARRLERITPGMPTGYLVNPEAAPSVSAAIQGGNDIEALQFAMRSLIYSLNEHARVSAFAFADHLADQVKALRFSDKSGVVAASLRIAQRGRQKAEVVVLPHELRAQRK